MGIQNVNYVCFKDRTNKKASGWTDLEKCPVCGQPMSFIGHRWRVPRKTNDRDWKIMEEKFGKHKI